MEMGNTANCKIPIGKANPRFHDFGEFQPARWDAVRVEAIPESSKGILLALEAGLTEFDVDQFLGAWNLLENLRARRTG
jgi:hypothetical protein